MKRCPDCRRDYQDDTLVYCLDDGAPLLDGPSSGSKLVQGEQPTQLIPNISTEQPTRIIPDAAPEPAVIELAEPDRNEKPTLPSTYAIPALIGLAVILVLSVSAFYYFRNTPQPVREIRSIAVLPLENLSGDASQEYFADGMTEALIGNLSQIGSIKVISRTSVMRYKKSGKSIPEIAKELGVEAIVEGSVQRSGDRIRISTQLIDAANDSLIWTRNFERQMSDILSLQSEIAQALAGELRAQLTPAEQNRIGKTKTLDPQATEANLLGKHYFRMWTKESERKAVQEFQKAVSIEPEYAEAWANLADAWTVRAMVGDIGVAEAEKPTRDAAHRALAIDPENGAAHMSMCFIQINYGFDWEAGENSCKRAIELDPNNAKAHFAYAYLLSRLVRHDEMAEQMEQAIKFDPAEPWWPSVYGSFLLQARRFQDAERYIARAIEVNPNYMQSYGSLSELYVELGRFDEALALREKKGMTNPIRTAYIYARKGDRQKALEILSAAPKDDLYELALAYTALDDFDNAFEVINRSLDRGEGFMFGYGNFLVLDKLKADPRWKDVRRRLNLPG
jgi:TolB-like protein/Tfp pilus assembly protein PilF